jgi:hypothetical protein
MDGQLPVVLTYVCDHVTCNCCMGIARYCLLLLFWLPSVLH